MTETSTSSQDPKTVAIIAHMTLIGWIIALVMNNNEKSDIATFYLRQMLGLLGVGIALWVVFSILMSIAFFLFYYIWLLVVLGLVALWVMSLIGAVNGEKKETPILGEHFQKWFTFI